MAEPKSVSDKCGLCGFPSADHAADSANALTSCVRLLHATVRDLEQRLSEAEELLRQAHTPCNRHYPKSPQLCLSCKFEQTVCTFLTASPETPADLEGEIAAPPVAEPEERVRRDEQRTYRRGQDDGRLGHPPAEATKLYLRGYSEGCHKRNLPHEK